MNTYPSDILVEADWLEQHLQDPTLRVVDARASDPRLPVGYRMGHVPGAVALDVGRDFFFFRNGVAELASPDRIAELLAKRGISDQTCVLIYDEWTGQLAAFTYWALRYVGQRDLKVLHGGWAAWQSKGKATTREVPSVAPAVYHARPDANARATAEWIQENADRSDVFLLDVRTQEEYTMGHIPGALNLPYDFSLDAREQTFKDADALRARLEAVGATPDKEIVTYCASGARSSHAFVALQLLGYPRVRNYDGSMADWYQAHGLPIE